MDFLNEMHNDFVEAVRYVVDGLRKDGTFHLFADVGFDEEDIAGIAETAAQELGERVTGGFFPEHYHKTGYTGFYFRDLTPKPYRVNVPSVIGVATPLNNVWHFFVCEDIDG